MLDHVVGGGRDRADTGGGCEGEVAVVVGVGDGDGDGPQVLQGFMGVSGEGAHRVGSVRREQREL